MGDASRPPDFFDVAKDQMQCPAQTFLENVSPSFGEFEYGILLWAWKGLMALKIS
jgi:hypothetical protein